MFDVFFMVLVFVVVPAVIAAAGLWFMEGVSSVRVSG